MVNVTQESVFVMLTDKLKVSVDKDSEDVFLALYHNPVRIEGPGLFPLEASHCPVPHPHMVAEGRWERGRSCVYPFLNIKTGHIDHSSLLSIGKNSSSYKKGWKMGLMV